MNAALSSWAAWSPGIEDADAWRRWCEDPSELSADGKAAAAFLPPMLRRRCGPLTRVMLTAAFDCCSESDRARVATVFATRHGNINESIELLERVAREQPLSPTRFSHTVHNAQAGLFSIASGNRQASSSIAAQEDSFASGWLEALTLLEREPGRPVLLVVADVPLAETFAGLVDEPPGVYAVALLLESAADGGFGFALEASDAVPRRGRWPDAVEFLRWYLSGDERLELSSSRRRWRWTRPS